MVRLAPIRRANLVSVLMTDRIDAYRNLTRSQIAISYESIFGLPGVFFYIQAFGQRIDFFNSA